VTRNTPAVRIALGLALVVTLVAVPAALAGKGGGRNGGSSSSSTITGPLMVVDNNGDGLPNRNDTVTFNVSTTATAQPYVHLVCSGNGVGYDSWKGVFAGSLDSNWNFVLSSGGWTSGAADCTAWLGMYTKQGFKALASTSFHVNA
jgi:hypothetical protein